MIVYMYMLFPLYRSCNYNGTESVPRGLQIETNSTYAFILFRMEGNTTEGEPPLKRHVA